MTFWSAHTHSHYSIKDALPGVNQVVATAVELEYPALGLTDHGNMAGAAGLYVGCRRAGIKPLPGIEAYVALDRLKGKRPATVHLGMLATSALGYRNLVGLNNLAQANFRWKPVLDMADLAAAGADGRLEGVAVLSGCWFGLLPTLLREGDPLSARNLLIALDSWFGSGLFVELQHHNVIDASHDDPKHAVLLHSLAQGLGLPVVLTQDSHYCRKEDRRAHDTMKRLTSWSDDPDDAMFPGDGYHMVGQDWMEARYGPTILADGLAGLAALEEMADVSIPELDEFKVSIPQLADNPDEVLLDTALEALQAKLEAGTIAATRLKDHTVRVGEEADVVETSGMAGYILMAADVCRFMREKGITFNVRGSAAGSHLCWLLGITSFNTLRWKLPFDRFLSTDRTKMPDIDIDVEHRRRGEVLAYLRSRYHVTQISTWLKLSLEEKEGDQKGSLLVRWKTYQRKTGRNPNVRVAPLEWARLVAVAEHETHYGYGVHPAGLMITPDEASAAAVPLVYVASSKTMVTAFNKDDVEALGLVKLDVLGLRTLTAMRIACELAGVDDWRGVPLTDKAVYSLIRSGRTVGVFQLEGGSSARGVRQMGPTKIEDIIAAMALFRPATLQSGATERYIARRRNEETVPPHHPLIEEVTAETYGVLLYQEQVLAIMKALGLTVEEIERGRKAIKASNQYIHGAREILTELRAKIRRLGAQKGLPESDQDFLDAALDAYAGYGFNRAHAASYGILSYATAYFRVHHPLEFWTGMLDAYDDSDMEVWYGRGRDRTRVKQGVAYRLEAQLDGCRVLGPHVNRSKASWTLSPADKAIRAGLTSVHGLGQVAAAELVAHAPYTDLADLAMKVSTRRVSGSKDLGAGHSPTSCGGVVAALARVGALSGLAPVPVPEPKPKVRRTRKAVTA